MCSSPARPPALPLTCLASPEPLTAAQVRGGDGLHSQLAAGFRSGSRVSGETRRGFGWLPFWFPPYLRMAGETLLYSTSVEVDFCVRPHLEGLGAERLLFSGDKFRVKSVLDVCPSEYRLSYGRM